MAYEGVVLDLDGTVYRGDELVAGAAAALERLREAGASVCLFSNNPTKSREAYVERLAGLGVEAGVREVLSAGTVTTDHLVREHADDAVYVVGSSGLRAQLSTAGLTLTDDPHAGDVVVVSFYRGFDCDTMREGYEALKDGVPFLGSDPDVLVPTDDGMVPGSGAVINAVAGVAGRDPDRVLGKPSPEAVEAALDALDAPGERCLVVGDRPGTDIALGEGMGAETALVLTGVTDRADVADVDPRPDHVLDSLAEVDRLL
jgi:4-nitrophenyl phosphatase